MEISPYALDWGEAIVDSYNIDTKNATLIYNFDLQVSTLYIEYLSYAIGHIYWAIHNLPAGSSVTAIFDMRGMDISQRFTDQMKLDITSPLLKYVDTNSLTIIFKRH